ncbi:MAG: O-methyltransferase, partial [Clostridia bacterium]|nr:O-methyltransferase [Clostridia bacterium]
DNVLFRGYIAGENEAPTKRYKTIIKRLNNFIENCKNHKNLTDFELITLEDGLIFAKKVQDEK